MVSEITEFKGNPIIKLKLDENDFGFSFGMKKANLILEHIEDIKKFVTGELEVTEEKVEE